MRRRFDRASPDQLILQRKLHGDGSRWRTVIRFGERGAAHAQRGAELLWIADPESLWRVVDGADPSRVLAQWDGAGWV